MICMSTIRKMNNWKIWSFTWGKSDWRYMMRDRGIWYFVGNLIAYILLYLLCLMVVIMCIKSIVLKILLLIILLPICGWFEEKTISIFVNSFIERIVEDRWEKHNKGIMCVKESTWNFEFYIAFASKLGGATGLNRIVKERWQIDWYGW